MANGNTVVIEGNLTRDPELRYSQSGMAILNLGVAWNQSKRNGNDWEDIPHFFDVTVFDTMAENVASSYSRGDRVVVSGRLDFSSWETDQGDKRSKVGVVADVVAASNRWASTTMTKVQKGSEAPASAPTVTQSAPVQPQMEDAF